MPAVHGERRGQVHVSGASTPGTVYWRWLPSSRLRRKDSNRSRWRSRPVSTRPAVSSCARARVTRTRRFLGPDFPLACSPARVRPGLGARRIGRVPVAVGVGLSWRSLQVSNVDGSQEQWQGVALAVHQPGHRGTGRQVPGQARTGAACRVFLGFVIGMGPSRPRTGQAHRASPQAYDRGLPRSIPA